MVLEIPSLVALLVVGRPGWLLAQLVDVLFPVGVEGGKTERLARAPRKLGASGELHLRRPPAIDFTGGGM